MIPDPLYRASAAICEEVSPSRWRRASAKTRDQRTRRLVASSVIQLLHNTAEHQTPECRLFLAIVDYAIHDLLLEPWTTEYYQSAQRYLQGPGLDRHCRCIGLDAEYVRRVLERFWV